jgi:hypothetical protein
MLSLAIETFLKYLIIGNFWGTVHLKSSCEKFCLFLILYQLSNSKFSQKIWRAIYPCILLWAKLRKIWQIHILLRFNLAELNSSIWFKILWSITPILRHCWYILLLCHNCIIHVSLQWFPLILFRAAITKSIRVLKITMPQNLIIRCKVRHFI